MATVTKKTTAPAANTTTAAAQAEPKKTAAKAAGRTEGESAFAFSNPMMSDAARERYEALLKSFNENAEEFNGRAQEFLDAGRESFEATRVHMTETGAEMMEAARREMADAVDFANELSRAKTLSEALDIQRDYWTSLFETRAERMRTMSEASAEIMREAAEPMQRTIQAAFAQPNFNGFEAFFPSSKK